MSSMIERVARAMVAEDSGPEGSALFNIHWQEFGEGYMKTARAAIEAMREPTETMKDAWNRDFSPWLDAHIEDEWHMYKVMIDAALKS